MSEFWKNFLREGTDESMTRLVTAALVVAGIVMSLCAAVMAFFQKFDVAFGTFVLGVIGLALGGKVSQKFSENKKSKNGEEK